MKVEQFNALVQSANNGDKAAILALINFVKPINPDDVNLAGEFIFAAVNKAKIEAEFQKQAESIGFKRIADSHSAAYNNAKAEIAAFVQALADMPLKLSTHVLLKPAHAGVKA